MFSQVILDIFRCLLKTAIWGVIAFVTIPLGILVLFLNIFPDFTMSGSLMFWAMFGFLNMVAFYFLWKPVLRIVTGLNVLFKGQEEIDQE